jgi:tetratricopeptide (TPR) repeat protein
MANRRRGDQPRHFLRPCPAASTRERQPGDQPVVDDDRRPARDGQGGVIEPCFDRLSGAARPLDRRIDLVLRDAVSAAHVRRPVRADRAEAQPAGVHTLDVDRGQRGLEAAGNLDGDRHAAAGHPDDDRLVEPERGDDLGQDPPGSLAITKERRDPGDEPHRMIVLEPHTIARAMTARREITPDETRRLLALSREARWTFPSSAGNPVLAQEAGEWVEQLAAEQDSFVEAARFLIENGDEEAAVELAANVWRLWMLSRDIAGGRAFLASVLDAGEGRPSRARALALYGDGLFAFWQGAHEDSRQRNEAVLAAAQSVGDPEALALAHLGLSRVAVDDGDHERARSLAARAREFSEDLGPAMGQAPLHLEAQATRLAGDHDHAAALFEESLALNRRLRDDGMVGVELHNLGHVEIHRGNVDRAERYFAECTQLASGDDPYGAALTSLNQAAVALGRRDHDGARALLARTQSILEESRTDLAADDQFELDWLRAQLPEA